MSQEQRAAVMEPWIDAHVHFARPGAIDSLLAAMGATHCRAAVIFGMQHAPDSEARDAIVYAAAK